ncbi:MAG TPA: hypothetical protein VGL53_18925 [Bryobacteraceae bacterium]|jgi:hypothetical protein
MTTNTSVFGLFPGANDAEKCLGQLRNAGVRDSDISILIPESSRQAMSGQQDKRGSKAFTDKMPAPGNRSPVSDGLVTELAGAGVIAIPGMGSYIAVGPIKSALTESPASDSGRGEVHSLAEGLLHFGLRDNDAKKYESKVKSGNILFGCRCESDWADRAQETLEQCGAEQLTRGTEADNMRAQQSNARSYGAGR